MEHYIPIFNYFKMLQTFYTLNYSNLFRGSKK